MLVEQSGPTPLIERLGERIDAVSLLDQSPPGMTGGIVLHFAGDSVAVADLGDELVVAPWPADDWSQSNVSIRPAD